MQTPANEGYEKYAFGNSYRSVLLSQHFLRVGFVAQLIKRAIKGLLHAVNKV